MLILTAWWQDSRILHGGFWKGSHCSDAYPPSPWASTGGLDAINGWWIYARVYTWISFPASGCYSACSIPSVYDIFSWLPRKVSLSFINQDLCLFKPRMLMTCLRYLSLCPCPRCLLLKSQIPMIGTKTDTKQRINLARVDSEDRREKIEHARKLMFEGGVNITSDKIERLLRPTSLVPTRVCIYFMFHMA